LPDVHEIHARLRGLSTVPKVKTALFTFIAIFELAPIILVMNLLGALIVFAQGSSLAPFIYTLF
jgi:Family of unknown function (DUF5989)